MATNDWLWGLVVIPLGIVGLFFLVRGIVQTWQQEKTRLARLVELEARLAKEPQVEYPPIYVVRNTPDSPVEYSDGYHTFGELYEHRTLLFLALIKALRPSLLSCWRSRLHHDGTKFEGYFIVGLELPTGKTITYHLKSADWYLCDHMGEYAPTILEHAPEWDGHTAQDVCLRLQNWIESGEKA